MQSELLQSEVIDYAVRAFGRELQTALATLSDDLAAMRRRKEVLEKEIQRFAAAIAHGGPLDSLVQELATREAELKGITTRLLSSSATSIDGRLREIRQFVEKGISDLRGLLNQDAALAKSELHSHLSEIRMTPTEGREELALRGGRELELARNWPERASSRTGAFGWLRGSDLN